MFARVDEGIEDRNMPLFIQCKFCIQHISILLQIIRQYSKWTPCVYGLHTKYFYSNEFMDI